MELTSEQMQEIHDLLAGLLEERNALDARQADFEQEMIAFSGTADELDQILQAYRTEAEGQAQAAREHAADVLDQIKGILTLKQGEILQEFLPGLLGNTSTGTVLGQPGGRVGGGQTPSGQQDEDSDSGALGLRERFLDRLQERFPDAGIVERLQQRLGGSAADGALPGGTARGGAGVPFGVQPGRRMMGVQVLRDRTDRGLDRIEQLVEVLELKLEAIG
jgi:hypothetical protein